MSVMSARWPTTAVSTAPTSGTVTLDRIIGAARERSGSPMFERIAQELIDASKSQGTAVKKKEDLHRMAEANRAFVHFRW